MLKCSLWTEGIDVAINHRIRISYVLFGMVYGLPYHIRIYIQYTHTHSSHMGVKHREAMIATIGHMSVPNFPSSQTLPRTSLLAGAKEENELSALAIHWAIFFFNPAWHNENWWRGGGIHYSPIWNMVMVVAFFILIQKVRATQGREQCREPYGVGDVKCPRQVGLSSGGRSHKERES